ncbi:hypothetical protein [Methylobacterium radiotolerans]|nr:hypothetical protein [Methylobacterium radiotolerans]
MSSSTKPDTAQSHAAGRSLILGENQILTAEELERYKLTALARGHYVGAEPASYGGGKLFVVRTYATREDYEEGQSLLYLRLPPVAGPSRD